jgi:RND family efflux transporter MFP subunit
MNARDLRLCYYVFYMNSFFQKTTPITQKTLTYVTYIWTNKSKTKVWIPAIIIILFLFSRFLGGSANSTTFTYKVAPKEFIQKVSLTGKVIAAKNVDMGFETSSRVQRVNVKVGDRVRAGAVLASLANGDLSASVQKNAAIRNSEQAKLDDLNSDAKKEERKLALDTIASAEIDLKNSEQTFLDQIRDTYSKADEAVRFNIDATFQNPRSSNPEFAYLIDQNTQLRESLKTQRMRVSEILTRINSINSIEQFKTYRGELQEIQKFINDVNLAMSIVAEKVTQSGDATYITKVNTEKTQVSLGRTLFNASIAGLNQGETVYKNSISALTRARNELSILDSSATPTQLAIQRANIQSAQASVGAAQAQLGKTLIRAPFDGVITKVDIKEGEISSPNKAVISMLNDGEYQIETYVSENDISKLKVDQVARVTLDAYGRDVFFEASVISLDPAETLKDGVSTYRTKIQFTGKDERVKSGMTANIDIETAKRADVLQIPQTAIVLESGVKKVKILNDTSCVEKATSTAISTLSVISPRCATHIEKNSAITLTAIQTGEISNTGDIEILSGITKDQTIIYSIKTK